MSAGRTIKHKTQAFKGLVTGRIGRTTRNRRQRQGRLQAVTEGAPGRSDTVWTPPGRPQRSMSRQELTAMKQTDVRAESQRRRPCSPS